MKSLEIIVKTQVEGIHRWKDCDIDEVMFLKYPHRHMFHIEMRVPVEHGDRDIEIIKLKRGINKYLGDEPVNFGNMSCEMIAEELMDVFNASYVKVLEDNENGALLTNYE